MFVIKNLTKKPIPLGNDVSIDPGEQLSIAVLSPEMNAAWDAGHLQVKDGDETLAERKADIDAINSFKP
jgi:hypothetical protein